jgi:hypothetical protein
MEILAADDMQGREAGTAGHQKAAKYVAMQYAEMGLQPFGDRGSYFQDIDFLETRLLPGSESIALHRYPIDVTLETGQDFARSGGFAQEAETIIAPLVFVGFGIRAPEYEYDDFAGIDVAGKILVAFTGAPPHFANDERAFYSSGAGKQALAAQLGGVGIMTIVTPVDRERMTWARILGSAGSSGMRWLEADGTPHEGFPQLSGNAILSESGAEQLFAMAQRDLDALFNYHADGGTGSFDLEVTATLKRQSVHKLTSSPNVLALLPGSDAALRDEYVLFTAHLDHLGIRNAGNDDRIFNGAYDNAAGVGVMIELARAMASLPLPPRRSIIFAAVTAEEKGLRGSDFLAHNPPVHIQDIVANINIDMPFLGYPIADVEGFGVEHSTLQRTLTTATAQLGLTVTPDPRPELVRLIRSDQFSFVKQGVPGLNLKPGSRSTNPAIDGAELRSSFLHDHYHGPSDDLSLPYSEVGATRFARAALTLGLLVANDDQAPRWIDNDFFGNRYATRERVD